MESRSVNNIRFSKDDMRRVYRDQARQQVNGVKLKDIIEFLDIIILPNIPHFFANKASKDRIIGLALPSEYDIGTGRFGIDMDCGNSIHRSSRGRPEAYDNGHYERAHVDHYGDRIISEEEFERLLDYAEQCNDGMY